MKDQLPVPVIAIFDVGKTNKKLLLFDRRYQLVYEESSQFDEIKDEDGFPCEDIRALTDWLLNTFSKIKADPRFDLKALNFSGYGASFVLLNASGEVFLPLYNYLKPFSPALLRQFYDNYGGERFFARQTASPVLGNLNSGMQLYRIRYEHPAVFEKIKWALHLPQYLCSIFSSAIVSDITSIGCHTNLWDFTQNKYHDWVAKEDLLSRLAPIRDCGSIAGYTAPGIPVGIGIHDSSAALIPYLTAFSEPFVLLSTGTWCISLNPFNQSPLTDTELEQDCLCYLSYQGRPVKASRLFAGHEHELQIKRLSAWFNKANDYFTSINCDVSLLDKLKEKEASSARRSPDKMLSASGFAERNLENYSSYEEAYHQLMADIVFQQIHATSLVLDDGRVKKIFVDGGFGKNPIYMHLLAEAFPGMEVWAASVAQASAIGAAMAIHPHWNDLPMPPDIIDLKLYSVSRDRSL